MIKPWKSLRTKRQRLPRKNLDRTVHQRSKKRVATKLHPLKRKILQLKRSYPRKGTSLRLCTRVLRQGDTDHRREAESREEGLRGDTPGPDESALRREEEGFQDLPEDTTDTQSPEAEADRGTNVMDRGAECHRHPDAGDPTLGSDQSRLGDSARNERSRGIAEEAAAGQGVDLDDPP